MDETLENLNKQIKDLESEKQKHILEKKIEKHAEKETTKIRKQFGLIIKDKIHNKELIDADLDELFGSLKSFYKTNYDVTDASYLKDDLAEVLGSILDDAERCFADTVKSKKAFIESLKELKKVMIK